MPARHFGGYAPGMSPFGNWCLAYVVALIVNDASATRLSSALARRYGKSTARVLPGSRSRPVVTAGTRSVSPVTSTTVSQASSQTSRVRVAPMATSVSFFERDESTPAQRAGTLAALELPEARLHARSAQRLQIAHLPMHDARPPGLQVMGERREVDDSLQSTLAGQRVEIGRAQREDIELAQGAAQGALAVEQRVIEVEAVDKEDRAVDD